MKKFVFLVVVIFCLFASMQQVFASTIPGASSGDRTQTSNGGGEDRPEPDRTPIGERNCTIGGNCGQYGPGQGRGTLTPDEDEINDEQTVVPNPLYGEYCEDLLGCEGKYLNKGETLETGYDKTYIYKKLIPQFIKYLLYFSGGLAVLMIVYAGMMMITAEEDEERRKKAVKLIVFSVIGLFVMTLSRAIVSIVENLPLG